MTINDMTHSYFLDGNSLFESESQMNEAAQSIARVVSERILSDIKRK